MKNNPLVSIVIPTYNQHENFLRECIDSAINQTYHNIEIIISDNHSTNGASEIINFYANSESRIRVVKPEKFVSLIENFIFAYGQVKGEYICPLSSDDILYPQIVEELLQPYFTYPDLSFCYSKPLFFKTDIASTKWVSGKLNTGFYPADNFLELFISYRDCSWGGILVKTENYNKVGGFSREYLFTADIDITIKLILLKGGVYCINKAFSAIRNWEREEQVHRTPVMLDELGRTYDNIIANGMANKNEVQVKLVKKNKWKIFSMEALPIAYFTQFNKRAPDVIDKTVLVIKKYYPKGIFNFVATNRKNKLGLIVSIFYLGGLKILHLLNIK